MVRWKDLTMLFMWIIPASCGGMSRQLENMAKKKAIECNVKLRNSSDENKLEGDETRGIEPLEHGEACGVPVANKQLAGEKTQLKEEIRNLKAEIQEIKAVKDKELISQKEEILRHEEKELLELEKRNCWN